MHLYSEYMGLPRLEEFACSVGDVCLIPGLERASGGGNGNPLKYSCLGNSMDRGIWHAAAHGVAKSQTWLSTHTHSHIHTSKDRRSRGSGPKHTQKGLE